MSIFRDNDDDNYADGIDWYCDECNAYLNDQSGFNTSSGRWTCSECGYNNDVTENNIIDTKDDYDINDDEDRSLRCVNCQNSLKGGEYTGAWENGNNPDAYVKCPHCGYVNFLFDD